MLSGHSSVSSLTGLQRRLPRKLKKKPALLLPVRLKQLPLNNAEPSVKLNVSQTSNVSALSKNEKKKLFVDDKQKRLRLLAVAAPTDRLCELVLLLPLLLQLLQVVVLHGWLGERPWRLKTPVVPLWPVPPSQCLQILPRRLRPHPTAPRALLVNLRNPL